jgi:hypothetical protein
LYLIEIVHGVEKGGIFERRRCVGEVNGCSRKRKKRGAGQVDQGDVELDESAQLMIECGLPIAFRRW